MKICVVGCGAVGSLFAANLAQLDDVEVWAYDASQAHVDAINANGLRLSGAGEVLSHPRATADPAELPACDFGIVATKAMHTDAAIARNRARVRRRRGRHCAERDRQRGGARTACRARDPRHDVPGGEDPRARPRAVGREGRHDPRPVRAGAGSARPRSSGSPTPAPGAACRPLPSPTRVGPQWRKVIFNASTNPVGALTGLTHGRVCERPDLRALVSGLVDEGKAVAAAQGIELDSDPEALIDHAAKPEVAYNHKASMLQDVEARRSTEIDYLNGGIVRFGREHGVPTPLNAAIWALVKGVEQSWQQ